MVGAAVFSACTTEVAGDYSTTQKQKEKMTLEQMKDMFANMRAETKWNVDGDMLWGYFFTDPNPEKLESAAKELSGRGYHFVKVYQADDMSTHWLHVERIETHTPQSLHIRNGELYKLADELGLESYDGMDVGPVEN